LISLIPLAVFCSSPHLSSKLSFKEVGQNPKSRIIESQSRLQLLLKNQKKMKIQRMIQKKEVQNLITLKN